MTDKLRSFSSRHCEISSNKKTACLSASAKSPGVFPSQNIALKNYSTVKKKLNLAPLRGVFHSLVHYEKNVK